MKVKTLVVGNMGVNCHLLWCPDTRAGIVIDPGGEADAIISAVEELGLDVQMIINTHGHLDHIGANAELVEHWQCPLSVGVDDAEMLPDPEQNLSANWGAPVISPKPERLLADGDKVRFGTCELTVISTPGHTRGGICLHGHQVLVAGDTLFQGSIGRSDLPGGDHQQLLASIKERLLTLPDDTRVLTGHGPETTIGRERADNPWLQG
ncbi:MAG: MBL fold metallo-hydrolase [Firmicutes bacterium]|nr:MBL fold metallo-hydrolase [Bacillota bacterium]